MSMKSTMGNMTYSANDFKRFLPYNTILMAYKNMLLYWLLVLQTKAGCLPFFSHERHNVQMLRASLSESPG